MPEVAQWVGLSAECLVLQWAAYWVALLAGKRDEPGVADWVARSVLKQAARLAGVMADTKAGSLALPQVACLVESLAGRQVV